MNSNSEMFVAILLLHSHLKLCLWRGWEKGGDVDQKAQSFDYTGRVNPGESKVQQVDCS